MQELLKKIFKSRDADSHKGTYGKLYFYAGSYGMMGAAIMSLKAANRSGVGVSYIASPINLVPFYNLAEPVAVVKSYDECNGSISRYAREQIISDMTGMDALVIGPGLGQSDDCKYIIEGVLNNRTGPIVIDADGLNNVSYQMLKESPSKMILTPHYGEFAQLLGISIDEAKKDGQNLAIRTANELQSILVLKGYQTIVTDGSSVYINQTGNPGLATAGSGDVLSGIIGAMLAMGNSLWDSAVAGVYLHGYAGDICALENGQYGMVATDIIDNIPKAIMQVTEK